MTAETDTERPLYGLIVRYVLTYYLQRAGQATVAELVASLESDGFRIAERQSKVVSDALRWEVRRGRVVRLGRGRYGVGRIPRGTRNRIERRYRAALVGDHRPRQRI